MNMRVYKHLRREDRTPTCEATLRAALHLWRTDPASCLTEVQAVWLVARLQDQTPLTPKEHRKLVPLLLAWSRGQLWESALIRGLRGVVDATLLPEDTKG
jgi:hypothetical protein